MLLHAGANPTAETTVEHLEIPAGSTPLSVAEHQGHAEIVRLLEAAAKDRLLVAAENDRLLEAANTKRQQSTLCRIS